MITPSIIAHIVNGALLLTAFVYGALHYDTLRQTSTYRIFLILLMLSLAIGIHGLSHLGMEQVYGYFAPLRRCEAFANGGVNGTVCACPCMKYGNCRGRAGGCPCAMNRRFCRYCLVYT